MNQTIERGLTQLLAGSATLEIATSAGRPWIAAAFFAEDGPYVLQLMLEARGRTLAYLRENPAVAVMIQRGDAMAPFAQGEGHAVPAPGEADAVRSRIIAKTPASAPLVGIPDQVAVYLHIDRWQITDVPAGWLPARVLLRPPAARPTARPAEP